MRLQETPNPLSQAAYYFSEALEEMRRGLWKAEANALILRTGIALLKNDHRAGLSLDDWENLTEAYDSAGRIEDAAQQTTGDLSNIDYILGQLPSGPIEAEYQI